MSADAPIPRTQSALQTILVWNSFARQGAPRRFIQLSGEPRCTVDYMQIYHYWPFDRLWSGQVQTNQSARFWYNVQSHAGCNRICELWCGREHGSCQRFVSAHANLSWLLLLLYLNQNITQPIQSLMEYNIPGKDHYRWLIHAFDIILVEEGSAIKALTFRAISYIKPPPLKYGASFTAVAHWRGPWAPRRDYWSMYLSSCDRRNLSDSTLVLPQSNWTIWKVSPSR